MCEGMFCGAMMWGGWGDWNTGPRRSSVERGGVGEVPSIEVTLRTVRSGHRWSWASTMLSIQHLCLTLP